MEKGKQVFMQTCFVCHQPNGEGIAGQIPPLAKSDFLMADKERSIRIVLQGLTGEDRERKDLQRHHDAVELPDRRSNRQRPDLCPQQLGELRRIGDRG